MREMWKKFMKKFGSFRKMLYLCIAFDKRGSAKNFSRLLEGWVSGWNHQFAKLTYGLPYRGFESPTFRLASQLYLYFLGRWWIHLRVRIQDSQSCHRGSNPLSTTRKWICAVLNDVFECRLIVLRREHQKIPTYYSVCLRDDVSWLCVGTGQD